MSEIKATDHLKEKIAENIKVEKQILLVLEAMDSIEATLRNLACKIIQEGDLNSKEPGDILEQS